jgi:SAM-dependent methyltransferase
MRGTRLSDVFLAHRGHVSDKWEQYLAIYEAELAPFLAAGKPVRLLEIGVQNGGSLQIWRSYLPPGSGIVGIDIDLACAKLALGEGISVLIGDAGDPATLDRLLGDAVFDIIVDDGSHRSEHIIAAFESCWRRVAPGGLFIAEDLHCSYFDSHGGGFRNPDAAIEHFKALADAVNADHFEADATQKTSPAELDRLRDLGRQIARVTFYDSVTVVQRAAETREAPYRRVMTGLTAPVADLGSMVPNLPMPQLRTLSLSSTAAEAFEPALRASLIAARQTVEPQREAIAAQRETITALRMTIENHDRAAIGLRCTIEDQRGTIAALQKAQAAAANEAQALRCTIEDQRGTIAALQEAQAAAANEAQALRCTIEDQRGTIAAQREAEATARGGARHLIEQAQIRADVAEARAVNSEAAAQAIASSTTWRVTRPLRSVIQALPPSARVAARRAAKAAWWTVTGQLPARLRARASAKTEQSLLAVPARSAGKLEPAQLAMPAQPAAVVLDVALPDVARAQRFPDLAPLPVFATPIGARTRLSIVTDSVGAGSLYGGVGTALIMAVLLARRIDADLRIVTRTESPDLRQVTSVLAAHGLPWDRSLELAHAPRSGSRHAVPTSANDLFLTTSWWTTRATLESVPRQRVAYLLQEDERMFYPHGDDRLLCTETLSDPNLLYVVNSELLLGHLQAEALAPGAVAFEPSFPHGLYRPEASVRRGDGLRTFFFYARPHNARNLYWRGIEALSAAIEEGVLQPEAWEFVFAGHGAGPVTLPLGARSVFPGPMALRDYAALLQRTDLALSLMYTPHPSYPPLDLAASGAVVVTNRFGSKKDLDRYSPNIICADTNVASLVEALRRGVAIASDPDARSANFTRNGLQRDWQISMTPAIEHLAAWAVRAAKL